MTPEQHANSTAPAPYQISEEDRRGLQEAYRMIHAIAARSGEEKRIAAEKERARMTDNSPRGTGDTDAVVETRP